MPAEASSLTLVVALAAAVVAVVFLPLLILGLAPFVIGRALVGRRSPRGFAAAYSSLR